MQCIIKCSVLSSFMHTDEYDLIFLKDETPICNSDIIHILPRYLCCTKKMKNAFLEIKSRFISHFDKFKATPHFSSAEPNASGVYIIGFSPASIHR